MTCHTSPSIAHALLMGKGHKHSKGAGAGGGGGGPSSVQRGRPSSVPFGPRGLVIGALGDQTLYSYMAHTHAPLLYQASGVGVGVRARARIRVST